MIRVDELSKAYKISHQGRRQAYQTLRESLVGGASALLRRRRGEADGRTEEFWALKGVEFAVAPGEVVGVVGHNGAGKSTLLKILSKITKPTTGRVELRGRVGSLLEVGTGFHPELTGRENVYLNGAILGMSRREVALKFDEIVAFAEVEKFLDTPVKRYSSGMHVRLAFAVASHLEPEILIIDEVLAVGDLSFQKKCLGRMGDVSRSGRTILFVSHNMAAIESLCDHCMLLDRGTLLVKGETKTVLAEYIVTASDQSSGSVNLSNHQGRTSRSIRIMTAVTLKSGGKGPISTLKMGDGLSVMVEFDVDGRSTKPVLGLVIKTNLGLPLFTVNNRIIPNYEFESRDARGTITCHFDNLPLMPGNYIIDLYFGDEIHDLDVIHDSISFDVIESDVFGSGKIPRSSVGTIFWPATWECH